MFDPIKRLIQRLGDVPNNKEDLRKHIFSTYIWMRIGMSIIALAFPVGLVIVGLLVYNVEWQDSMSAYYWALPKGKVSGDAPMRIYFVGLLFALSCCLILYKGYVGIEDWILNVAGVFALCVALIPMCRNSTDDWTYCYLHNVFAFGFFGLLAVVAGLHGLYAWGWLRRRPGQEREKQRPFYIYAIGYIVAAVGMILAPIGTYILGETIPRHTFWAEFVGIFAFCLFWLLQVVQIWSKRFDEYLARNE